MELTQEEILQNARYLSVLSKQYPTVQAASTEIINLQAILTLPKGTEHFMSDLHGEHEAFAHILNNASGVIREKVDALYSDTLSEKERAQLAALIYYPKEKLEETKPGLTDPETWYTDTLHRLLDICRLVASKYTRSKVRKALPKDFEYILDELLHGGFDEENKKQYYGNILQTILDIGRGDAFILALSQAIKRLVVDRLHIVGDIFDRGPRADLILDMLMRHHAVDIQWGNHDILWMGAAAGSRTCIANVLNNSITYNNLEVLEMGYGISLRPLALFANEVYGDCDVSCFFPKLVGGEQYKPKDLALTARMHKAIAVMLFKLEGQIILRNPSFQMSQRLLLQQIDYQKGTVRIGDTVYKLKDCAFPTVDPKNPYALIPEEAEVMAQLSAAFTHSEKLQRHARFLYSNGGLYLCANNNLLFHGCIPMDADGSLSQFDCQGHMLSGRSYMNYVDAMARQGYYAPHGSRERQQGKDFLWFLWCGRNSPLSGREKIATFERLLIADEKAWAEPKNPYYTHNQKEEACIYLLKEFGLTGEHAHIINGHIPVRVGAGESPVKAGGRLIVIDGGFCKAYQPRTGIAGYTLVYNSYGLRLISHEPFPGTKKAIKDNLDILSSSTVFQTVRSRIRVGETDVGSILRETIAGLKLLLTAYRTGALKERLEIPLQQEQDLPFSVEILNAERK